jgi:hypothetical protein
VLFLHQVAHELGLVGKLVVKGPDADSRGATDVMDARSVAGLAKNRARRSEEARAFFFRATLGSLGRPIRQGQNVFARSSHDNLLVVPFIWRVRSG